ncbi:hypothetical protein YASMINEVIRUS_1449 [Yasminevirus sp. GU-2018]|uniref:Phosphoacetylglucosamine mutase n=1 Tax=Yasminevirus sp. GU-2018 TaxID=2420051 RepID=A0A5K0UA94_9VIRU|nr:hypothetical protein YASMINEVIRUS_1449 [Yasminevirus sp. GU-2018]
MTSQIIQNSSNQPSHQITSHSQSHLQSHTHTQTQLQEEYYPYGTSGFRFDEKIMIKISKKIGVASGVLLMIKNSGAKTETPKNIGIMITASHNLHFDNGVKIVDETGTMLTPAEENLLESIVNDKVSDVVNWDDFSSVPKHVMVFFGNDTRRSGDEIKKNIVHGLTSVVKEVKNLRVTFVDLGLCTTPEFHVLVSKHNCANEESVLIDVDGQISFVSKSDNRFIQDVKDVVQKYNIDMSKTVIDCANGVGAVTMHRLALCGDIMHLMPTLINTDVTTFEKLNERCGSDYIMTSFKRHHDYLLKSANDADVTLDHVFRGDVLHASFDGDADRIVFYTYNKDRFSLITGDNISMLILNYALKSISESKVDTSSPIKIVVVHTGYSNGGFMRAVDDAKVEFKKNHSDKNVVIDRVVTPIGVKNLIDVAKKYDVGVYFEANGHGSIVVNNHHDIEGLKTLKMLFNDLIGDAIMNLVGVTYLLESTNTTPEQFRDLFTERESMTVKIHVKNKNIYKTNYDQTVLTEPTQVVNEFKSVMENCDYTDCRAFVRPSGTEDILRLYVENNGANSADLNKLVSTIKTILI